MRFLKLRIKNITSLKNEHFINFEEIQESSSLFAITGDTGSGKSSILNSVSLALFGEVYKKNTNQVDLVSLGEKEAEIQLIFQVQGKYYLADWKAKVRKSDGEFLKQPSIQRVLFEISSPEFHANKIEMNLDIEKIIGLNFDQFCKCIMLNQGEFAKFLTSSFTERKEILERLYSGEELDKIGRLIKENLEAAQTELKEIEIKLNETDIHSTPIEAIDKESRTLDELVANEKNLQKKILTLFEESKSFFSSYLKMKEYLEKIEKTKMEISRETNNLNLEIKVFHEIQLLHQEREKEFNEKSVVLQKLLKSEEALKIKLESIKATEEFLKKNNEDEKELNISIEKLSYKKKTLEEDLQILRKKFQNSPENIDLHFEEIGTYLHWCEEIKKSKIIIHQKEEILQQIENQGKALKKDQEDLKNQLQKIPDNLEKTISDLNLKKELAQKENSITQINKEKENQFHMEISEIESKISQGEFDFTLESKDYASLKIDLSIISKKIELLKTEEAIQLCRTHVKDHHLTQCPVCLSTLATEWEKLHLLSEISNDEKLKKEYQEITEKIGKKEKSLEILTHKKAELSSLLISKKNALNSILHLANRSLISIENIENEAQKLKELIWEKNQTLKLMQDKDIKITESRSLYKKNIDELKVIKSLEADAILQLERLDKQTDHFLPSAFEDVVINSLKNDFNFLIQFKNIQTDFSKVNQDISNQEFNLNQLKIKNQQLIQSLHLLTEETKELKGEISQEVGELTVSEVYLKLRKDFDSLKKEIEDKKNILSRMQISINEQESKVASLLDLVKDHENIYTRAISLIKSVSLELVHPLLGDSNEVLQKISDSSLSSRAPYELQHIFSEKILSIAEELKVKLSDFRSRWAVLEQMKSDYQTKKRRFDELTSQRSEKLKLKDKLSRLNLIIGKDELRSFVLSMIEKNLVSQTNFELNHLCFGRYQISQQFKSSKISPDFYIIDKFNNGERRKISTLSGGETFMVSLAMALALSELTRGKTEINTLFIDEGFGTLDLDSLSDVIEMLNQIQTRGLMIGIISHVKSLTDSLPINIHLSKMTSGNSKMRIIYH